MLTVICFALLIVCVVGDVRLPSSQVVEAPSFNPNGGIIIDGDTIVIASPTQFVTICYTTDGIHDPKCSTQGSLCMTGTLYEAPITKRDDMNGQIWKSIACKSFGHVSRCGKILRRGKHGFGFGFPSPFCQLEHEESRGIRNCLPRVGETDDIIANKFATVRGSGLELANFDKTSCGQQRSTKESQGDEQKRRWTIVFVVVLQICSLYLVGQAQLRGCSVLLATDRIVVQLRVGALVFFMIVHTCFSSLQRDNNERAHCRLPRVCGASQKHAYL